MQRLNDETWKNIFRNINEVQLEQEQDAETMELVKQGLVKRVEVEVVWLDGTDEWALCCEYELFEDGFNSEQEAQDRLDYLENKLL